MTTGAEDKACTTCGGATYFDAAGSGLTRPCPRCRPEAYGAVTRPAEVMDENPAVPALPPTPPPPSPPLEPPDGLRRAGRVARMPEGLPQTSCVLRAWNYASALSALYFGLPVYLVGGALTDPDPRDVDIVIPMPEDLFLAAYNDGRPEELGLWQSGLREANPPKIWRRWARDCAKTSRLATMFCGRRVDFKVQPQAYFDDHAGPRVRLDCVLMPEPGAERAPAAGA